MMKNQWTAALFGAGLLGIPALAAQEGNAMASLQAALDATRGALEEIVGLEPRIAAQDEEALNRLLQITEEPSENPQRTDEEMVRLRGEIQRLQGALDQGPSFNGSQRPTTGPSGINVKELASDLASKDGSPKAGALGNLEVKAFEESGYTADELAHAKLLVRAKRFQEAEERLRKVPGTPESRYWLARALKGLGKSAESREMLRVLSAEGESAHRYARWASQDLRMIELREKLNQQTKQGQ